MDKPGKDDIIELEIDDLSFEGKGVGRLKGDFVVFVPNTVPGDLVKARVKRTKKNYSEAGLEEVITQSDKRVEPYCIHFGTCNGCKMQNIDYPYQLELKRQNVINAFERIGGFKGINVPPVLGSDNIYYYRNKLEFSFSNNRWLTHNDMENENADRSFALGYHIPGFIDKILDIQSCRLQSETSNTILNLTREFFKSRNTSVYSTKTHTGYLRFLVIKQSAATGEIMVNLITHEDNPEIIADYAAMINAKVPEVKTLINSISRSKAQVAQADESNIISGRGYIEEFIGRYKFKITPNSFFQTNSKQCEKLFNTAVDFADFSKDENVLDLYCGSGTISLFISGHVKSVYGVELSNESIAMAKENAELNGVSNCAFEAGDVRDFLRNVSAKGIQYDTIIVDPPRSGLHPDAVKILAEYGAKKIIYVSCNPTTQARDIEMLGESYRITKIQPVDMFPHTFHIENVVRLDKNN